MNPINGSPIDPVLAARIQAEARHAVLTNPVARTREALVASAVQRYLLENVR